MQLQRLVFPTSSYTSPASPLKGSAAPPVRANTHAQRSGNLNKVGKESLEESIKKIREEIAKKIPGVIKRAKAIDESQKPPKGFWDQLVN